MCRIQDAKSIGAQWHSWSINTTNATTEQPLMDESKKKKMKEKKKKQQLERSAEQTALMLVKVKTLPRF